MNRVQPEVYGVGPGGDGPIGAATEAVSVATFGVDVELGGDFDVLEREEPGRRVLDVDRVVLGLDDEGGRSLRVRLTKNFRSSKTPPTRIG